MDQIVLTEGVRVRAESFVQVKKDHDVYRVTLDFISDFPDKNRLIKHYYVWLTDVFTEDYLRIRDRRPKEEDYSKVALALAEKRFKECDSETPPEEGLDASNERGILKIKDTKNYIHPVERPDDESPEADLH